MTQKKKNVGGRPREHDRDQMAADLIEWAKQDDSINLNAFCAMQELAPSKITQWASECDRFRKAYELAKTFLGVRREIKLSNNELHVKAYDLNAPTYDYFLKQEKRDQAEFESKLKDQSEKAPLHDALVDQQNNQMKENHALRKRIADLELELNNKSKTG